MLSDDRPFKYFFVGLLGTVFYDLGMGRRKDKRPEVIDVSDEEVEQLKKNLANSNLGDREKKIILSLLETYYHMVALYRAKKLSVQKLVRMFGFKSEKQERKDNDKNDNPPTAPSGGKGKQGKGHGRRGKNDFPGAKKEFHPLEGLKKGDPCPECPLGRLYPVTPGSYIHFTGSAALEATIHETEKLRCNGCGKYFEAELDDELKQKYHPGSDVAIALQKYSLGLPFYRMGKWQNCLGIPLSPSTQWDRCEQLMNSLYPVYQTMLDFASNGNIFHGDDTGNRILDYERNQKKKKGPKRAVHTTGVLSQTKRGWISLFFTRPRHCGENMTDLLKSRSEEGTAIFMSDALSRNLPKEARVLWANCNSHARRNFWDYRGDFPQAKYALFLFGQIYYRDKICKERNYSPEQRLRYHQKHSARIMEKFRRWAILQVCRKKVEPNGELGRALQYFLKHYRELTLFLRIPGAPIDNNIVESLLKIPILNRKNAYFYKSQFGALVGDAIMSLVETCKRANKNPFHYLLSLHKNKNLVKTSPSMWLPWNYEQALKGAWEPTGNLV